MSFEITGKLIAKYDAVQKTQTFKTREFVIERNEDIGGRVITNYIKFQCTQERTSMPDRFNIGDEVKISFNIRGTKWVRDGAETYFTNLDAWRMEHVKLAQEIVPEKQVAPPPDSYTETADDLPF